MTELLAVLRLVDDLRNALTETMNRNDNPAGTPGAKVDMSRLDAPTPATVRVASVDLPPPFDSMEEAQRAAGIVPTAAASYRVCVRDHGMSVVGDVIDATGRLFAHPEHWLPCDKDGWVSDSLTERHLPGVQCEVRVVSGVSQWRPLRQPQFAFTTGHADAIPKPSALDEMAEQVRRWAVPESVTSDEEIATFHGRTGVLDAKPALAVQEGGSHYKSMKIQPVEYIHANGLGYFEGNVVKYVSRWRSKGGLQDLKKARHYLDLLIELEGGTK
jgi:hypothetical protein